MLIRLIIIFASCLLSTPGLANPLSAPLPVMQMNPAMLRYFDPASEAARIEPSTDNAIGINQHYTTIFLADALPTPQRYFADMEIYVAELQFKRLITPRLAVRFDVLLLRPYKGVLDSAIRQFHNTFGMPDNGRHLRPDNIYNYQFSGAAGGWNSSPRWEPGNLSIGLKHLLHHDESLSLAVLAGAKLATANRSRGWGSGHADMAAGAAASWEDGTLFSHLNLWWVHPFNRSDLGYPVRDYFRSSLTAGWRPELFSSWLDMPASILVQVQGGTSPYRAGVLPLDRAPWLISFGANFLAASGHLWNLTFTENITQRSTQDFGLTMAVQIPVGE